MMPAATCAGSVWGTQARSPAGVAVLQAIVAAVCVGYTYHVNVMAMSMGTVRTLTFGKGECRLRHCHVALSAVASAPSRHVRSPAHNICDYVEAQGGPRGMVPSAPPPHPQT